MAYKIAYKIGWIPSNEIEYSMDLLVPILSF